MRNELFEARRKYLTFQLLSGCANESLMRFHDFVRFIMEVRHGFMKTIRLFSFPFGRNRLRTTD
jgi:hypothetical protein